MPLLQEFQTLRQGMKISVQEPERSWYDLTGFRQLALAQVDFMKTARDEVVLVINEVDESRSRAETQVPNRTTRKWTLKKSVR